MIHCVETTMGKQQDQRQYKKRTARRAALHTYRLCLPTLWTCMAVIIVASVATDTAIHVGEDGVLHIGDNGSDTHVLIAGIDIHDLQQQMGVMRTENSMMQQRVSMVETENSIMNKRLDRLNKFRWQPIHLDDKLTASDAASEDRFGSSVAAAGNRLLFVGAHVDDDNVPDSGSVYVFEKNSSSGVFEEKYKLTASDAAEDDRFGRSVSVDGDLLFVGASYDDDGNHTNSGSVYVFELEKISGVYEEKYKLTASDAASDDLFGASVSADGDHLLFVGARFDDENHVNSGSVYVFEKSSVSGVFEEKYKLTASDAASRDYFGYSVSVDGDLLFIGAHGDDDNYPNSGSVYVFEKNSVSGVFEEKYKLTASDAADDDSFGSSVSADGDLLFVGAYRDNDKGPDSGSVYVFSLPLY